MQLFITKIEIQDNLALLKSKEIFHQLTKVLRAQPGYVFQTQEFLENGETIRYTLEIVEIQKDLINCKILEKENQNIKSENFGIIVCLPNSFDKLELMVQKLTEIGIPNIVLRASHRSIIREINFKKMERLNKIILEACEQSKSWSLPKLEIIKNIKDFIADKNLIILNFDGEKDIKLESKENMYFVVGPEGGFDSKDLEILSPRIYKTLNLGENVLRTETGAIIGGRLIKNHF